MIKVIVNLDGVERTINGDGQNIKGTITQEVGAINSFEFEIFPQNIGFDLIQSRKTLVKATNTATGRVEFAGRVLLAEQKMESNGVISKRVTCESYLGYLYDSVQPFAEMETMPLRNFLQLVINNHNERVESSKQMQLGTVDVEVADTGNVTKGLQYDTTYDTIKSKLVDIYGGELEVVENNGVLTLNYVKQIGATRATTIELGRNMQAASREVSPLEIITRLIPLGAKIKKTETDAEGNETETETSERLTLVGYTPAGGSTFTVPWIDDEEKQKECGIVCGKLELDDVTTQSNLYNKAIDYMQNKNLVALSHTLTALDLKEIGQAIDGLNCGDSYPVKNKLIGLDEVLRITKKTIDINAPYKSSITIGEKRATLSSIQADTNATIGELFGVIQTIGSATNAIKEHVSSAESSLNELNTKIEGIEGTYFYIRYSPYSDGHVMTDAPEPDTEYMGTCSTSESTAPTDYTKYNWVKIKGEQGEQGVAGKDGTSGKTTYFHVKYSAVEKPTSSSQLSETPSKYIGTYVDYTEDDSTDPSKYTWSKFMGDNGENGIAGTNGIDGKTYYLHIKYSDDGGATLTANNGETTGEYIGVYTDTTEADSTDVKKYKWSKIKGDRGAAGAAGADGKTSYLHIKYSDDGKTFTGNLTPADITKWESGILKATSGETADSELTANAAYITYGEAIPVTPSSSLAISTFGSIESATILACYGADRVYKSYEVFGSGWGTLKVPSDVYYIRVSMGISSFTSYEAFAEAFSAGTCYPDIYDANASRGEEIGAYMGSYVDFEEYDSGVFSKYKWVKLTADVDEDLKGIKETITLLKTDVSNNSKEITLFAEKDYIERDEYKDFKEHTESTFTQTAQDMTMEFGKTVTLINNASSANKADIESAFNELKSYIRYSMNDSGQPVIELGASASPLICRILNDKIAFLQNGVEVAYLSNNQLYITDATILTSLNIGGFKFTPRSNGNLSFGK